MRHLLSLIISCLPIALLSGQAFQVPLSLSCAAGSAGETAIHGNMLKVEWSIGEVFISGGTGGGYAITQGEQQSLKNEIDVGIKTPEFSSINVFPNPASQYIVIDNMPQGSKIISIHDSLGYLFYTKATKEENITIPANHLPSGIYILTFQMESYPAKAYKLSVHQL